MGFDSTSRKSNLPLADFISDYVDRAGVRISRNPSVDGSKTNLLISMGPEGQAGAGLMLSGHMDAVPAEEPGWGSDPFRLTLDGDTYVGRATADMKGFLALAINRFLAFDPAQLRHPLVLLFTYDEEVGTLGARRFVETWPTPRDLPRDTIIGEPTSLRVVRLHKGMLRLRLGFEGRAAHSGYPHLGRNAIEPAGRAVVALGELRRTMEAERPTHGEHFPQVPFAALNVGTISGGSAMNVIPDRCIIELGIRLLPEMSAEKMAERVHDTVASALPGEGFTLELVGESPAMMLSDSALIYQRICRAVNQRATHSVAFATDAGWLQRMGLQCVLFGPGSIEVAHRANEFIPVAEFHRGGRLLEEVIHQSCVQP